jgi:hypothetical protein
LAKKQLPLLRRIEKALYQPRGRKVPSIPEVSFSGRGYRKKKIILFIGKAPRLHGSDGIPKTDGAALIFGVGGLHRFPIRRESHEVDRIAMGGIQFGLWLGDFLACCCVPPANHAIRAKGNECLLVWADERVAGTIASMHRQSLNLLAVIHSPYRDEPTARIPELDRRYFRSLGQENEWRAKILETKDFFSSGGVPDNQSVVAATAEEVFTVESEDEIVRLIGSNG